MLDETDPTTAEGDESSEAEASRPVSLVEEALKASGEEAAAHSTAESAEEAAPPPAKKAAAKRPAAKRAPRKTAAVKAAEAAQAEEAAQAADAESGEAEEAPPAKKAAAKKTTTRKAAVKKAATRTRTTTRRTTKAADAEPDSGPDSGPDQAPAAPVEGNEESSEAAPTRTTAVLFKAPERVDPELPLADVGEEEAEPEEAAEDEKPAKAEKPEKAGKKSGSKTKKSGKKKAAAKDDEEPADTDGESHETPSGAADEPGSEATGDGADDSTDDTDDSDDGGGRRRGRRRGGRRRRRSGSGEGSDGSESSDRGEASEDDDSGEGSSAAEAGASSDADEDANDGQSDGQSDGSSTGSRRRRRRRRSGSGGGSGNGSGGGNGGGSDAPDDRSPEDQITSLHGSTRLEAKKQRRREGREAGRRRAPIVSEAEFLARRESVERVMAIRQRDDLTQIAVLEDKVLVEHYVARESQTSLIGNVYLGRVQNVLPSMEAAFIDIGKGRNAVLYAGEVNWKALGAVDNQPRKIEAVLKSGQTVLVQVSKDPIGHKGARLTSQISLPGRFLVYVPDGTTSGISRKLPEGERNRLKTLLKQIVPASAGVIVRTAAEGASEEELTQDVERLTARWADIEAKVATGRSPALLYGEPDLTLKVVRDLFTEDFTRLVVQGDAAWDTEYKKEFN